jgi:hypothetical protein
MVAVGGAARDERPVGPERSRVDAEVDETAETLENPEGLGWASAGSWTDIAVKSSRHDILKQAMGAFQQAVEAEGAEQRRADKDKTVQLTITLGASIVLLIITITFLTVSLSDKSKSVSWALVASAVATMGFSAGSALDSMRNVRRSKKDIRLFRAALEHETKYRERISARDECV